MATPALQPPPTMNDAAPAPQGQAPPPTVAAPAPPKPAPQTQATTAELIRFVRFIRGLAQSYPAAVPHAQKIGEEVQQLLRITMEHQETGEPAAPPVAA